MAELKEHKLRHAFIESFVYHLIKNAYKPSKEKREKIENIPIKIIPPEIPKLPKKPLAPKLPPLPKINKKNPFLNQIKKNNSLNYPAPPLQQIPIKGSINLGKIAPILSDPSVFSIEVPGPQKNILVNRSGKIQTAQTTLSKEEIKKIMNEISDKTRIPLSSGLFKTAFQNIILTAVISDFVGTRFIIQKRTPFQGR